MTFVPDQLPQDARHIDELLAKAREADAEVARLATGAKPAGDANPYRVKEKDEDEGADER